MITWGDYRLVIWVEKVKTEKEDLLFVEAVFVNEFLEKMDGLLCNKLFKLQINEIKFLYYIIYYLSSHYGIDEIIQSDYLITDSNILFSYKINTTDKKLFGNYS